MMNRYLSASLLAVLGWTGLASAQGGLGTPVAAPESSSVSLIDCRSDCKPKANHPILGNLKRTMMTLEAQHGYAVGNRLVDQASHALIGQEAALYKMHSPVVKFPAIRS